MSLLHLGPRVFPLTVWMLVALCSHACVPTLLRADSNDRPNIVLILADDLGYGDLGCYGNDEQATPVLDRLATQGVRWTQAYANGPECSPTRAALLTGRYQQHVGGLECAIGVGNVGRYDDAIRLHLVNELGLPANRPTLAKRLSSVGYETALFGKWHLGYEAKFSPMMHGFDEALYCIGGAMDYYHYLDSVATYNLFHNGRPISGEGYFTDTITDQAVRFIGDRNANDKPFFLYLPYTAPHTPYQAPGESPVDPLPIDSPLWKQNADPPGVYRAMVRHMDEGIGKVLHAIEESKMTDRTLVIFASDNGGTSASRNEPLRGFKGQAFEGGIRVPLIARWPGHLPEGVVSDQVTITFDLTASMLAAAGITPTQEDAMEGIDVLSLAANDEPVQPRTLYWRKPRDPQVWSGMRDGNWKYVRQEKATVDGRTSIQEWLFNLADDISEQTDLASQSTDELDRLRGRYLAWEQSVRNNRRGRPGWAPSKE
ncbi:MAG TPA: N-acetylgalactosamine-6-sulfatase [Rhodopirellula baltica]|uniref:N-acetylgalactosamine-6-sulfate sulfatase n=1 Tax=Rhodopirellula baltica (strain DSM 10527 / NCIMB 13988 / SH1) TaxID=243090 RepID=Q7UMZ5_RHOBA|nr:sulfatase-like hydrolase/transferase [Rhodopirellula baltica]CAD75624.1 N-acetylgalactosamine-6-sulfate sulfatase [Rhodopirellula baltica SH 1]HBE65818.1 N-acetylgalactosamine-6-sulfatase [Rhodopirellula baltica]